MMATRPPGVNYRPRRKPGATLIAPFSVLIDTREQRPYLFSHITANADQGGGLVNVPFERGTLHTGDYSIVGMPEVVIERKSKEDLYGSVVQRDNFVGRLERMDEICNQGGYACVMVEAGLMDLLIYPPQHCKLNPKSLSRTLIAWRQRYRADWYFIEGRGHAEQMTFRILERWWLDHYHGEQPSCN